MGQTNFLQALGWAVLNSLWQMALLWVVYQFIIGINKSARSSFKSSLASFLLISGFGWFTYTFFSVFASESAAASSTTLGGIEINWQLNNWLQKTLPVASVIYLLLLTLPLLHFIRNYSYVQKLRHVGLVKADVQWRIFVNKVAGQMGIRKKVQVWISELVSSPVTMGFLKPVILFPVAAVNRLSTEQVEAILLHELSHIRRYDYLINLCINAIQTILYFNPFVKAFVKAVEREREKSCDEMVMQFQYDPHGYASALLILEKANHLPKKLAIAAAGRKNDLLNRVEHIMGVNKKPIISFNKLAGLFAGLLCVIALNALLIINKPATVHAGSFPALSSPFSFFTGGINQHRVVAKKTSTNPLRQPAIKSVLETSSTSISNRAFAKARTIKPVIVNPETRATTAFNIGEMVNVKYEPVVIPLLKNYQELQVKEALDASKRVLENIQWKAVEEKVADVMTQQQKDQLKSTYQKELDKVDWDQIQDRLRMAYDKIDWDKINDQLGKAVSLIRLDSLKQIYNEAASNLNLVAKELNENHLTGIPDTDITLKEVNEKKEQIQKVLQSIKDVKSKTTIHL